VVASKEHGVVLWLTGVSGAGKTTLAGLLAARYESQGNVVDVLDGDAVRQHLSKGLGFSPEDRDTNVQRIAWVASRIARTGAVVVVAAISPYAKARDDARRLIEEHARFVEIHVSASIETCARRDPKGLYEKAFRGEILDFTGVSAPYEAPVAPDVRIDTESSGPEECLELILARLGELRLAI
jgi:adenylyl-sulfate kinase